MRSRRNAKTAGHKAVPADRILPTAISPPKKNHAIAAPPRPAIEVSTSLEKHPALQNAPPDKSTLASVATTPIAPQSKAAGEPPLDSVLISMFKARMQKAFGTSDEDFISHLFAQTGNALPGGMGEECKNGNYFVAALHGIAPRDELEALLAVQMVSVHSLGMEFLKRAAASEQTDFGIEVYINRANKLLRVFANQVEALSRYRGKGEQKMIVEHVHVYKGGQAIVGPVNQRSGKHGKGK